MKNPVLSICVCGFLVFGASASRSASGVSIPGGRSALSHDGNNYDTSDSGTLWWVMTGATDGGDEHGGWEDSRPVLESIEHTLQERSLPEAYDVESGGVAVMEPGEDGFQPIFNGENFDGWYLKIRGDDDELAKKVFAIEDGVIHVFNEAFPDEYHLNTGANDTHGMFYTEKEYSKYVLRFEYKWGKRIANNFDKWQYDAGVYYHVTNDRIWPVGIEYQIRYDHTKDRNHTGDLIRPGGSDYEWYGAEDGTYLHPEDGGKPEAKRSWLHFASATTNCHALDDQWNQCEIIVMGDQYAIHKLNGDVVNMAFNPSPDAGIIGFQSETAEIFYRNIRIKEFDDILPAEVFLK